jgi:hypothetical protein
MELAPTRNGDAPSRLVVAAALTGWILNAPAETGNIGALGEARSWKPIGWNAQPVTPLAAFPASRASRVAALAGSITGGIDGAMWVFLVLAAGLAIAVWKADETSHRVFFLCCCLLNLFCFVDIYRKAHPYMFESAPLPVFLPPALPDCPKLPDPASFPPLPCKAPAPSPRPSQSTGAP